MTEQPLFSIEVILQMQSELGVKISFVDELIKIYLNDSQPLIAKLEASIESQQLKDLTKAAHSLKSSSAALGALRLAQMCREVEQTDVKALDWAKLGARIQEIKACFEQSCQALRFAQANLRNSA